MNGTHPPRSILGAAVAGGAADHLPASREYFAAEERHGAQVFAKRRTSLSRLAVLGAGSWGTALAIALAPRFDSVGLWARDAAAGG